MYKKRSSEEPLPYSVFPPSASTPSHHSRKTLSLLAHTLPVFLKTQKK